MLLAQLTGSVVMPREALRPGLQLKAGLARMRFALPQSMPSLYRLSNQPTMKNDGGFNGLVVHSHCGRVRGSVAFRLEMVSEVLQMVAVDSGYSHFYTYDVSVGGVC